MKMLYVSCVLFVPDNAWQLRLLHTWALSLCPEANITKSKYDYLLKSILNPAYLVGNMTTPLLVKTPKRSLTVIEVRRGAKFSGKKLQREQSTFTQLKQVGTSLLDV